MPGRSSLPFREGAFLSPSRLPGLSGSHSIFFLSENWVSQVMKSLLLALLPPAESVFSTPT